MSAKESFPDTDSTLVFLKLGGSLITDKHQASTARPEVIQRLAEEVAAALKTQPKLRLVLGHGSGSFGHHAAEKYGTRLGVHSQRQWRGFGEVWLQASALNRLVVEALHGAGLPAVCFPASAAAVAAGGKVSSWDVTPIEKALAQGLLPVVYGDVAFDSKLGGTILSTEDIFGYLAGILKPQRILLAGLDEGVYADYPANTRLLPEITPASLGNWRSALGASAATDVTGGMASKVAQMLALVEEEPGLQVSIFSGQLHGAVKEALLGTELGTKIHIGENV
jgi:isopentenyl phosphate kinase